MKATLRPLSWPQRPLWRNASMHWTRVAKCKKAQREEALLLVLESTTIEHRELMRQCGRVGVHLEFVFPDRRSRDEDNLIATCKAALDGIADAIGIDDSNFKLTHAIVRAANGVPGGGVRITLEDQP